MGVWLFLKTLWLQYGEHSEEISAHWEIGWKNGVLEENCAVEADEVWRGVALRSFFFSVQIEALIG